MLHLKRGQQLYCLRSLPSVMTCRDRLISGINILRGGLELRNGLVNILETNQASSTQVICLFFSFFFASSVQQLCRVSAEALASNDAPPDWTNPLSP